MTLTLTKIEGSGAASWKLHQCLSSLVSIRPAVQSLNDLLVGLKKNPEYKFKMKYRSTRGGDSGFTFEEVLFAGYASDHGLYVPESIPQIPEETLKSWVEARFSYPEVVAQVVRLFVSPAEIPDADLSKLVEEAYETFAHPEVIKFHSCSKAAQGKNNEVECDGGTRTFTIAELFHGKTASFKDLANSLLGRLLAYYTEKRKSHTTLLVGTSGDTGSSAIEAVRGLTGLDIIVLFPEGKIPRICELQMTTARDLNVHVYPVEGTSDDLDVPIKRCFPQQGIASINSLNWARFMIQIAHFVYVYLETGRETDIIVPTGAGGNVVAGVAGAMMGLPIKLYAATNCNDCFCTFINSGKLKVGGKVAETPASAMDIQNPYNVERLIHLFADGPEQVGKIMAAAEQENGVQVPEVMLQKIRNFIPMSVSGSNEEIYQAIKQVWDEHCYMVCPHTATGIVMYNRAVREKEEGNPVYILSTGSPWKFPETIKTAGVAPEEWDGEKLLRRLEVLEAKSEPTMRKGQNWVEDWVEILQSKINALQTNSKQ